jgi:hypothetical protein
MIRIKKNVFGSTRILEERRKEGAREDGESGDEGIPGRKERTAGRKQGKNPLQDKKT